jgi:hypothetical protein
LKDNENAIFIYLMTIRVNIKKNRQASVALRQESGEARTSGS